MVPFFLDLWEVVRIHQDQIERYGGEPGTRDVASLASAVAMAQAGTEKGYLHGDLFEMAAAYLFHIVRNHPFVDGNKRTGAASAIIFLAMNGVELGADEEGLVAVTLAVAEGKAGKQQVSDFLRGIAQ